ncbi:MAG TPA: hypothetical protein VFZ65_20460 [Planctomycetota bacterium]|nr:hypothetical protein [Planctomycetota bacterium]
MIDRAARKQLASCVRQILALALLTAPVMPQLAPAGSWLRLSTLTMSSGPNGPNGTEIIQRFDADQLRGFGIESGHPGVQVVRGARLLSQAFGSSIPNNNIAVTLYTEDPARPGYPDLSAPLAQVTNVPPVGTFGPTDAVFPTPGLAPIGRDVFVGVHLNPPAGAFGTTVGLIYGYLSGSSSIVLPGGAMPSSPPEANSFRLYRDVTNNALTYGTRAQYLIDLLIEGPSGMPTAVFIPGAAPGSTTLLAGLYPDATNPPFNSGRADNSGFIFSDVTITEGSPVAFLAAFADFGPIVALDSLIPGSRGGLCLEPTALFPLTVGIVTNHEVWIETPIPPAVRLTIGGQSWTQQAVGFDLATGTLRGTQCGKQSF